MEDAPVPAPAGSVSQLERPRHGPANAPPTVAGAEGARGNAGQQGGLPASALPADGALQAPGVEEQPALEETARLGRVLVLNATYEPINVCSTRRAVVLLIKEKAEVVESGRQALHAEHLTIARPAVIRLLAYIRVPREAHRRKITRRAVFARDGWACQYCGSRANLTVDHVIPRSKGGQSSWENIVASCGPCNRRKGDRSPAQAGMQLRRAPRRPHAEIFIHVAAPSIPRAWRPYLPLAA